MSFLEHLEELRWHLFRAALAVLIFAVALFIFRQIVFDAVFFSPLHGYFPSYKILQHVSDQFSAAEMEKTWDMVSMQVLSPYEQFMKAMVYSIFGGFILSFPFLIFELWRFIKPGLRKSEAKTVRWSTFFISLLFFTGVSFGYFIILPFSIKFFTTFTLVEGLENNWRIGEYISFVIMLLLGTGLVFQMPVVIFYLSRLGIITPQFLRRYRRHAIVIILVLAAFFTPPDPLSQVLIFVPLVGLYEIGIIISTRVTKRMDREAKSTALTTETT